MFNANKSVFIKDDNYLKEIQIQKLELQKERYKLQTEKIENNKWIRENARDELIIEKIIQAINNLPSLEIPEIIPVIHSKREYCLLFGDEHYGTEFEIRGLFNEIINSYSPEIFESRMWELLNQVIQFIKEKDITKLNVFSMGDSTDGLIRVKQLMKLRYGVIEGTVYYANFISNWLNELSKIVCVEFQMVYGNHTELRLFSQPKGTFKNENTGLFIRELIEARLQDNPNFSITKNPTGLIFANICNMNILGIHGEVKNLEQAVKDFSNVYKTQIDILIAGHKHHSLSENIGVNRDIVGIPSIIGVDDFSLELKKTANAGATIIGIEENKGKVCEENIKLN